MSRPVPDKVWTIINAQGLQVSSTYGFFATKKSADAKLRAELRTYTDYLARQEEWILQSPEPGQEIHHTYAVERIGERRAEMEERRKWRVVECNVTVNLES